VRFTNNLPTHFSGIIANFKDLSKFLQSKGFVFESDTDTEVVAKLALYFYRKHPDATFRELVELVCYQLVTVL
jgi:glucosamine--fructose-6-phosphate aminotransferase (isomerizing)